jgi:uncharacterized membrane protein
MFFAVQNTKLFNIVVVVVVVVTSVAAVDAIVENVILKFIQIVSVTKMASWQKDECFAPAILSKTLQKMTIDKQCHNS